ncbi:hypothetical protein BP00DRAFT_426989, partial [Aspergillus indologenus CBS 114.80]
MTSDCAQDNEHISDKGSDKQNHGSTQLQSPRKQTVICLRIEQIEPHHHHHHHHHHHCALEIRHFSDQTFQRSAIPCLYCVHETSKIPTKSWQSHSQAVQRNDIIM